MEGSCEFKYVLFNKLSSGRAHELKDVELPSKWSKAELSGASSIGSALHKLR